ncbi:MAG: ATP-grasp domain-containing protein [Bacilli bacterium]|jgi:D-alanine-D-alanine ligase|nr:ATP-grasp domain-containing protein [Bacilli bacterium]
MDKKLKVALVCNIKRNRQDDTEAEFDEMETIEALKKAISKGGFEVLVIEAQGDFLASIQKANPDIVFNISEGLHGRSREGQIPSMLEYLKIPFVGSDAVTLGVALDKTLTKRLVQTVGVKTPAFWLVSKDDKLPEDLTYPLIVKPNAEGSSKGISDRSVCKNKEELAALLNEDRKTYEGDFLLESYIDGREFTIGLIGNGNEVKVFEPMEIIYRKLRGEYKVYSYEVKRNFQDYISYQCPPKLTKEEINELKTAALKAYRVLGCLDFARIDFRMDEKGQAYFIEANPLPGLAPGYSDYPMLAGFNGVDYDTIVLSVLKQALKRYGMA